MTTTYNITHNAKFDSYEVTFESKPATAVLDALKALKMRWNPKKACWYGFAKESEILSAILNNGEGETITGEKTEGATVYTDGYLGGGAVYGSKSNLHLYGADLSKAIREDIKRAGIKGVTVRCKSYSGGQSIGVTVTLRPDEYISFPEFLEHYDITPGQTWIYTKEEPSGFLVDKYFGADAHEQQEIRFAAAEYDYERMTTRENRVNEFYIDEETQFTPETLEKIKTIQAIICAYRYDESNSQVDYFHTNFYYDIYTKPATVKPTTPDDEPTKPAKEEPKEEPAAEETTPVQPAEQAQEVESVVESEKPATIYKIDDNGHDIIVKCVGDDCYTVEYCEDGKRLGNVEENCTAEYIDFKYGIIVNPDQNTQNQPRTAKAPRYQVIVNDDRWGGLDEKRDYTTLREARKDAKYYVDQENWESAGIYDRRRGDIIETFGWGFPVDQINAREKAEKAIELAKTAQNAEPEPTPEPTPAETIPESAGDAPEEAPETAEPMPEPVKPSPIREDLARRAHEMMSYTDYREGSATAEYNALCDRARTLAEEQRKKVDPMYHDKIDALLASYVRRMADNINRRNEIGTRCPSVLVAGPANFPVRKKQKQNAASDKNMEEYNEIQGILNKIRSVGSGGISGDDPNAREKIEKKIESLEALQNTMKAVNAYYRKHKTLDGCPDITPEQAHKIAAGMERDWRSDPRPFEAYHLQNNNAEIHRLRERLAEMDAMSANPETGWTFDGGTVEICREDNRVRIFHDSKPDADVISELKSNGFKWARSVGAWQRQLTENAINAARRITT